MSSCVVAPSALNEHFIPIDLQQNDIPNFFCIIAIVSSCEHSTGSGNGFRIYSPPVLAVWYTVIFINKFFYCQILYRKGSITPGKKRIGRPGRRQEPAYLPRTLRSGIVEIGSVVRKAPGRPPVSWRQTPYRAPGGGITRSTNSTRYSLVRSSAVVSEFPALPDPDANVNAVAAGHIRLGNEDHGGDYKVYRPQNQHSLDLQARTNPVMLTGIKKP